MACSKTKLPTPKGGKKTSPVQIFLDLTLLNIFEANLPDLTHDIEHHNPGQRSNLLIKYATVERNTRYSGTEEKHMWQHHIKPW